MKNLPPTPPLPKLLAVEDNPDIAQILRHLLHHSFEVITATTGQLAIETATRHHFAIILLDFNLPDTTGLQICVKIRQLGITAPILFLTGRGNTFDKVQALNAGADDYMTKPFQAAELLARVRALIRRQQTKTTTEPITIGHLTLDPTQQILTLGEHTLHLRQKATQVLACLLQGKGQLVSRQEILATAWQNQPQKDANTVNVQIKYLRAELKKILPDKIILTAPCLGYKIDCDALNTIPLD